MIVSLVLALQGAAPLPKPLTDADMREVGCVATLALLADEQRRGVESSLRHPNVMQRGRKYAGIVGRRLVEQTGQPKEVIGLAIRQSVADQRRHFAKGESASDRSRDADALITACLEQLDAQVPAEAKNSKN